jgi:hypothetical protein
VVGKPQHWANLSRSVGGHNKVSFLPVFQQALRDWIAKMRKEYPNGKKRQQTLDTIETQVAKKDFAAVRRSMQF